ncbi:YfiM family lipoprotein [Dickeya sp. ws52]|uniref:YfiM family lipoprotein n=1 Tax=Dickeya sp. ws52 TaxID=2576377 RepID=UPI00117FA31C|nr:YfiM family lipoprotein [Dickeya sp. ws52]TYL40938.1 YfiM family lipoprotein [Dickeya sp. ws52]
MRSALLLLLFSCSGCTHMAQDRWTGPDKAEHFLASALISAASSEVAERQHQSRNHSATFGLMFSVSIGAAKETYDSRPQGSGWSVKDFTWDIAGATAGYCLWQAAHP